MRLDRKSLASRPALMRNKGIAVQKGIGSGTVFIVKTPDDIRDVPKGAILVSKRDFSVFVRLMNDVSRHYHGYRDAHQPYGCAFEGVQDSYDRKHGRRNPDSH